MTSDNFDFIFTDHGKMSEGVCKTYLTELAKSKWAYHIDDNASDIEDMQTGLKTFTELQAKCVQDNVNMCFTVLGYDKAWEVYWPLVKDAHGLEAEEEMSSAIG